MHQYNSRNTRATTRKQDLQCFFDLAMSFVSSQILTMRPQRVLSWIMGVRGEPARAQRPPNEAIEVVLVSQA